MSKIRVSATGRVDAPPETVYGILRDYGHHHPEILPDAFKSLEVEEGGIGEGTLFTLIVSVFGKRVTMRMRVDEPEPGRVLRETDVDDGTVTTFTVEPDGEDRCTVTFDTVFEPASGFSGIADRTIKPGFMRRLYEQELENLDVYARKVSEQAV